MINTNRFINVDKNNGRIKMPKLTLMTKSFETLGNISRFSNWNISVIGNGLDEISFDVHKYVNGEKCPIWDDLEDIKVVDVNGEARFEIDVDYTDNTETIKSVHGQSLECELGQINLYDFHVNDEDAMTYNETVTANDGEVLVSGNYSVDFDVNGNFIPTVFYKPTDPNHSLLHRVIKDKAPHWTIGHVPSYIALDEEDFEAELSSTFQRTYSADGTNIYEFLTGEVAKESNVVFIFDTVHRRINCYSLTDGYITNRQSTVVSSGQVNENPTSEEQPDGSYLFTQSKSNVDCSTANTIKFDKLVDSITLKLENNEKVVNVDDYDFDGREVNDFTVDGSQTPAKRMMLTNYNELTITKVESLNKINEPPALLLYSNSHNIIGYYKIYTNLVLDITDASYFCVVGQYGGVFTFGVTNDTPTVAGQRVTILDNPNFTTDIAVKDYDTITFSDVHYDNSNNKPNVLVIKNNIIIDSYVLSTSIEELDIYDATDLVLIGGDGATFDYELKLNNSSNKLTLTTSSKDTISVEGFETLNIEAAYIANERQTINYQLLDMNKKVGSRVLVEDAIGEDTTVLISKDRLAQEIGISSNKDEVKNCFRVTGGDDMITSAVAAVNMSGSNYIYQFADFQLNDMPNTLRERIADYQQLLEDNRDDYEALYGELNDCYEQLSYYQSVMAPNTNLSKTTAQIAYYDLVDKLTEVGFSVAVNDLHVYSNISFAGITSNVKAMAEVLVDSRFTVEIVRGSAKYNPSNQIWQGQIKLTRNTDKTDTYPITDEDKISLIGVHIIDCSNTQDELEYVKQKIMKKLEEAELSDIYFHTLDITKVQAEELFAQYSLARLESYRDAFEGCCSVVLAVKDPKDQSQILKQLYDRYKMLFEVNDELVKVRQKQVDAIQERIDTLEEQNADFQRRMNFANYLGKDLFKVFSNYVREDDYQNDNYISDNLETTEEYLNKAKELLETAQKEIKKACVLQRTVNTTCQNMVLLPEFRELFNKFNLFNYIRVKTDDEIFKLRIVQIDFDGENFADIKVTFSEQVETLDSNISDTESILQQAQSMGTSYSATMLQASQGASAHDFVNDMYNKGLNAAKTMIADSNSNELVINSSGLLARRMDDTGLYGNKQLRIIGNGIYMTDDAWDSVKMAIGETTFTDPITGQDRQDYGLIAPNIVGQMIAGRSLYISAGNGNVKIDERGITLGSNQYITWEEGGPVESSVIYYAKNTSSITPPESGWSTTMPAWENGKYIWQKTVITYADGTSDTSITCISGSKGEDGDGYTVMLTNDSHTFAGTNSHAIASSTSTNVIAYKNGEQKTVTIGTITGVPTGMTAVVDSQDSSKVNISVTTSMTTASGVIIIPIIVDGKTFNKAFNYSIAFRGQDASEYYIVPSTYAINKTAYSFNDTSTIEQIFNPSTISFNVYKKTEEVVNVAKEGVTGTPEDTSAGYTWNQDGNGVYWYYQFTNAHSLSPFIIDLGEVKTFQFIKNLHLHNMDGGYEKTVSMYGRQSTSDEWELITEKTVSELNNDIPFEYYGEQSYRYLKLTSTAYNIIIGVNSTGNRFFVGSNIIRYADGYLSVQAKYDDEEENSIITDVLQKTDIIDVSKYSNLFISSLVCGESASLVIYPIINGSEQSGISITDSIGVSNIDISQYDAIKFFIGYSSGSGTINYKLFNDNWINVATQSGSSITYDLEDRNATAYRCLAYNNDNKILDSQITDVVYTDSVVSTSVQYAKANSSTTAPTSGWVDSSQDIGSISSNDYIWTRARLIYESGYIEIGESAYDSAITKTLRTTYDYSGFKTDVARALSGGKSTTIGDDYIISPKIGGGYLYIANQQNQTSIEINPRGIENPDSTSIYNASGTLNNAYNAGPSSRTNCGHGNALKIRNLQMIKNGTIEAWNRSIHGYNYINDYAEYTSYVLPSGSTTYQFVQFYSYMYQIKLEAIENMHCYYAIGSRNTEPSSWTELHAGDPAVTLSNSAIEQRKGFWIKITCSQSDYEDIEVSKKCEIDQYVSNVTLSYGHYESPSGQYGPSVFVGDTMQLPNWDFVLDGDYTFTPSGTFTDEDYYIVGISASESYVGSEYSFQYYISSGEAYKIIQVLKEGEKLFNLDSSGDLNISGTFTGSGRFENQFYVSSAADTPYSGQNYYRGIFAVNQNDVTIGSTNNYFQAYNNDNGFGLVNKGKWTIYSYDTGRVVGLVSYGTGSNRGQALYSTYRTDNTMGYQHAVWLGDDHLSSNGAAHRYTAVRGDYINIYTNGRFGSSSSDDTKNQIRIACTYLKNGSVVNGGAIWLHHYGVDMNTVNVTNNIAVQNNLSVGGSIASYGGQATGVKFSEDINMANHDIANVATIYATSFHPRSDKRVKTLFDFESSFETIFTNLKPVEYIYNDDESQQKRLGFVAQDVEKSFDDAGLDINQYGIIGYNKGTIDDKKVDDLRTLSYMDFIPLNTYMIQKLMKQVDDLENELKEIKNGE